MDAGELVPDEIVIGVVEERLAPGRRRHARASCSTGSRARVPRPRSSTASLGEHPLDVVDRPRGARSRSCSTASPAAACAWTAAPIYSRQRAARRTTGPATTAAASRPARRRHRGGDPAPARALRAARPCRSSSSTSSRRCWSRSTASATTTRCSTRLVAVDRRADRSADVAAPSDHRARRADADRRDAPGRPGRRRDARGASARPSGPGVDHPRRSTASAARCSTAAARRSNFLGYHGFPAVICTSPNDVIVHGIPSDDVVLEDGDILSIDCGAIIEGWHADAAFTVPVGDDRRRVAAR